MIVVVGSLNLDVVMTVGSLPERGETVIARSLHHVSGGKGGNQAVAASRLGANVSFVGAVGRDEEGARLIDELSQEGIDVGAVTAVESAESGVAFVTVDDAGSNSIVVYPGANDTFTIDETSRSLISAANVVLLQLEIPTPTVADVVSTATGTVVLNAAPARVLAQEVLGRVDVLIVNETEHTAVVEGFKTRARTVITTLGERGCVVVTDGASFEVAAPHVDVVDTTGAGDTFCGAFAVALDGGSNMVDAARWATVAASLATTRLGARVAMPTSDQVDRRMEAPQ